jgi:hypothetical protein
MSEQPTRISTVLQDHDFLTGTVATALLYGYARLNVALFAWAAGIQPADLELGTEDYLFIAVLWAALTALCYFFLSAQQRSITRSVQLGAGSFGHFGQHVFGIVALSLFYVSVAVLFPSLNFLVALLIVTFGGLAAVAAVYFTTRFASIELAPATAILSAVALFLVVTGAVSSVAAGRALADDPPTRLPLPLQLVLAPHRGYPDTDPETCVRRVAPRVYVTSGDIMILADPVRFRSTDCDAERPR